MSDARHIDEQNPKQLRELASSLRAHPEVVQADKRSFQNMKKVLKKKDFNSEELSKHSDILHTVQPRDSMFIFSFSFSSGVSHHNNHFCSPDRKVSKQHKLIRHHFKQFWLYYLIFTGFIPARLAQELRNRGENRREHKRGNRARNGT
jgi:hypothetical protein